MTSLRATGLVRRFGRVTAVDGVDLEVGAGEVHALVGLNGSGKTTLLRMLVGVLRPDAGQITLSAGSATTGSVVGHLIDQPAAYAELTVEENLRAAALLRAVPRGLVLDAVAEAAAAVGISDLVARRAGGLSLGNRQRLGLAAAIVHRPQVLVLDEPTNAMDPAGVLAVRSLVLESARTQGCAVLVSSHHLDELARIADRITVLHRGRVVGSLDPHGTDLEVQLFAMAARADGIDVETHVAPPLVRKHAPGGGSR
ncbi:ABC transporter ATP-binding protein [uncultured Cellulomonas sp.]|uniref:ABC transporter ATP-binding protein n=1 Tax=uncultured Cellulomonas sp. TaxID=189682 RepID=UPI0028E27F16|nr:ABC transporter ATP-binding protein [uncultured Cellulomonas sp.]